MRRLNSYVNYNVPIRLALFTYLTLILSSFLNFEDVSQSALIA